MGIPEDSLSRIYERFFRVDKSHSRQIGGTGIRIPYAKGTAPAVVSPTPTVQTPATSSVVSSSADDVRERAIRVGVMLPLHNINGDGRRMVEYYRGILMACDSLKKLGISVDLHAWNTPEDGNISTVLSDKAAADRDIIFGPLYSKQMDALSDFVSAHDIRLVIPFSISAPQLVTNRNIFQIWQSPTNINDATITHFLERFNGYHNIHRDITRSAHPCDLHHDDHNKVSE